MLVEEINKMLIDPNKQKLNTNLKIIKNGGTKPTISDILKIVNNLTIEMRQGFEAINKRIDNLESNLNARIDNLVAKNNLKE